jgi:xanthine dehydrogenase/oxidase
VASSSGQRLQWQQWATLERPLPPPRRPQNAPNPRAVHSSKAIGEPPLGLGGCVLLALKDAVYAARRESGHTGWFRLDAPATPERLRMACADHITAAYAPHDLQVKGSI